MTKTEKTQKCGNYFDNCETTNFKYKYYLQIYFKHLPKQIRDYYREKQTEVFLQGALSIVISDNMK